MQFGLIAQDLEFQSTLPRRERQTAVDAIRLNNMISIHAPTKGATAMVTLDHIAKEISIHAPTKGATATVHPYRQICKNFNPRSHEGSDIKSLK